MVKHGIRANDRHSPVPAKFALCGLILIHWKVGKVIRETAARAFRQVSDRIQRKEISEDSPVFRLISISRFLSRIKRRHHRRTHRPAMRAGNANLSHCMALFCGIGFLFSWHHFQGGDVSFNINSWFIPTVMPFICRFYDITHQKEVFPCHKIKSGFKCGFPLILS